MLRAPRLFASFSRGVQQNDNELVVPLSVSYLFLIPPNTLPTSSDRSHTNCPKESNSSTTKTSSRIPPSLRPSPPTFPLSLIIPPLPTPRPLIPLPQHLHLTQMPRHHRLAGPHDHPLYLLILPPFYRPHGNVRVRRLPQPPVPRRAASQSVATSQADGRVGDCGEIGMAGGDAGCVG